MGLFLLPGIIAILLGLLALVAWLLGEKEATGILSIGDISLEGPIGFLLIIFGFAIMGI